MSVNIKRITAIACVALISSLTQVFAWGPQGHTIITQHAIALLPKEIKPFYDANSSYIVAFTMLPDDWRQTHPETAPNHYIDLDELDKPPFDNLIGDKNTIEKRFGKERVEKAGVLPWVIFDRYQKLVNAFKQNDTEEIVLQSALLAHFVGDAHVPMHTTKNYDGDKSEEKGIHFRWEENLPALTLKLEGLNPINPSKTNDILKSAFSWCISAYNYNETIFRADDKARKLDSGCSFKYYRTMSDETGNILREQLSKACEDLAGVYIAAWEEAGKPVLSNKCAPIYWLH